MGQLVFQAALGGAVNLIGPNISATTNFTLPGADGTNGQALTTNGSGVLGFSSIVSGAAGSNTQVQFNNGGNFGASSSLTWSGTILTSTGFAGPLNGTVGATTANTGNFTTLTTSSTVTVNGGTANGVTYLNGSKVLTSGSALTFDGTTLGAGAISATDTISTSKNTNASFVSFLATNANAGASTEAQFKASNGTNDGVFGIMGTGASTYGARLAGDTFIYSSVNTANKGITIMADTAGGVIKFAAGGSTEVMRTTSSGLAIGTSSLISKLTVQGASDVRVTVNESGSSVRTDLISQTTQGLVGTQSSHPFDVMTGGTTRARFDTSGNLGLGLPPSAWTSNRLAYQNSSSAFWTVPGSPDLCFLSANVYDDGAFKYIGTGFASYYRQGSGVHSWHTAASGTAGNAISATQAMTLAADGNLGVGTTSPTTFGGFKTLELANSSGNAISLVTGTSVIAQTISSSTNSLVYMGARSNHALVLTTNDTERARILADGSFHLVKSSNETEATAQFLINGSGYAGLHWLDATAYYIGQNSSIRSLRIYSSDETAGVNLAAGGTSWGTFSDERLKYDIEPITNGLNKLSGIRCVSYRLKDVDASNSQKKLGIIAQDLVGVVDEVIDITKRHGDETDYMSVRYTELIPVLVKAIQEQQAIIESLKARLDAANL